MNEQSQAPLSQLAIAQSSQFIGAASPLSPEFIRKHRAEPTFSASGLVRKRSTAAHATRLDPSAAEYENVNRLLTGLDKVSGRDLVDLLGNPLEAAPREKAREWSAWPLLPGQVPPGRFSLQEETAAVISQVLKGTFDSRENSRHDLQLDRRAIDSGDDAEASADDSDSDYADHSSKEPGRAQPSIQTQTQTQDQESDEKEDDDDPSQHVKVEEDISGSDLDDLEDDLNPLDDGFSSFPTGGRKLVNSQSQDFLREVLVNLGSVSRRFIQHNPRKNQFHENEPLRFHAGWQAVLAATLMADVPPQISASMMKAVEGRLQGLVADDTRAFLSLHQRLARVRDSVEKVETAVDAITKLHTLPNGHAVRMAKAKSLAILSYIDDEEVSYAITSRKRRKTRNDARLDVMRNCWGKKLRSSATLKATNVPPVPTVEGAPNTIPSASSTMSSTGSESSSSDSEISLTNAATPTSTG